MKSLSLEFQLLIRSPRRLRLSNPTWTKAYIKVRIAHSDLVSPVTGNVFSEVFCRQGGANQNEERQQGRLPRQNSVYVSSHPRRCLGLGICQVEERPP